MKHRPGLPDEQANVSGTPPLREALRLSVAFLGIAVVLYLLAGLAVDFIATRLPETAGASLREQIEQSLTSEFGPPIEDATTDYVRSLFNALVTTSGRDAAELKLIVVDNDAVNALAAPSGLVVVFSGLLDVVQSENELAMVLGHELGHIAHRDPLRMLGRGLVLSGALALVLGDMSTLDAQLLALPGELLQRNHSRARERAADRFGVELVCRRYGHGGGTGDFFERGPAGLGGDFFDTHPSSPDRVADIAAWRAQTGCADGTPIPLIRADTDSR